MDIKFGDQIRMVRDYDGGRLKEGEIYTARPVESVEDGELRSSLCRSLCKPGTDGEGAYAVLLDDSDEEDKV